MINNINKFLDIKILLVISVMAIHTVSTEQNLKGLYVDNFKSIIGNQEKEDVLFEYAKSHDFNYLILYNTAEINRNLFPLDQPKGQEVWLHFIRQAKTEFKILKIGIVGEKSASFIPATIYNEFVKNNPLESIDVFNLEFEFWNKRLFQKEGYYCTTYLKKQGFECSNDGAFAFYLKQLEEMKLLKGNTVVEIETYIGNPNDDQLSKIAKVTDRLLIHYYQDKTDNLASYKLNRLLVLQKSNPKLKIAPIFSARENHLGPWLKLHKIDEVPTLFFNSLESLQEIDFKLLHFDGYIWYRYSDMPKNN